MTSPDGSRIAYVAYDAATFKSQVILDGKTLGTYDGAGGLAFSPDGRHFAFCTSTRDGYAMILDQKRIGNDYPAIFEDSVRVANDGIVRFLAEKDHVLYRVRCAPVR
jgi:hypothetical protein